MADLEGLGTEEAEGIGRQFESEMGKITADLASRGLSATSIGPAMRLGLTRHKAGALATLRERVGKTKAGVRSQLTENLLRFMERREDEGPNMNLIAQLLKRIQAGR